MDQKVSGIDHLIRPHGKKHFHGNQVPTFSGSQPKFQPDRIDCEIAVTIYSQNRDGQSRFLKIKKYFARHNV